MEASAAIVRTHHHKSHHGHHRDIVQKGDSSIFANGSPQVQGGDLTARSLTLPSNMSATWYPEDIDNACKVDNKNNNMNSNFSAKSNMNFNTNNNNNNNNNIKNNGLHINKNNGSSSRKAMAEAMEETSLNGGVEVKQGGASNTGSLSLPRSFLRPERFEIPLPFGYHLDLDFLRFCSDPLVSEETLEKLKELRKQRRQQRKTLEALMGVKREERRRRQLQLQQHQQPSHARSPELSTTVASSLGLSVPGNVTTSLTFRHSPEAHSLRSREFASEALHDAVSDFEQLYRLDLEEVATQSGSAYKFSTLPGRSPSATVSGDADKEVEPAVLAGDFTKVARMSSSSLSSASSNVLPDQMGAGLSHFGSGAAYEAPLNNSPGLQHLGSELGMMGDSMDTESIASITSDMSTSALRSVREQMAKSLAKLKEYEKQVEAIPVLKVKLSVLKEEKRLLMLRLRQREWELRRGGGGPSSTLAGGDLAAAAAAAAAALVNSDMEMDMTDTDFDLDLDLDDEADGDDEFIRVGGAADVRGGGGGFGLQGRRHREVAAARIKRWMTPGLQGRRARSESPSGHQMTRSTATFVVRPDEFISIQKRNRTSSCDRYQQGDPPRIPNYLSDGVYEDDDCGDIVEWRGRSSKGGGPSDGTDAGQKPYFEAKFVSSRGLIRSLNKFNVSSARSTTSERSEVSLYTQGDEEAVAADTTSPPPIKHQKSSKMDKKSTKDASVNTEPPPAPALVDVQVSAQEPVKMDKRSSISLFGKTRDKGVNTDKAPPPPRKVNHSTNTAPLKAPVGVAATTSTLLTMDQLITLDEMETKVQEAIFKTEEEIMGCPLLKKAMAKVEEEALSGPGGSAGGKTGGGQVELADAQCQVGEENLRPFVIAVGLQCRLSEEPPPECLVCKSRRDAEKTTTDRFLEAVGAITAATDHEEVKMRSVGVGDCKVVEGPPLDPVRFREIGVCTEKWVEVIKASKQTDTDDFAFKDTESPRVADLPCYQPQTVEPDRVMLERRSSLRRSVGAMATTTASPTSNLLFNRKPSSPSSPSPSTASRKSSSNNNSPGPSTVPSARKQPAVAATRTAATNTDPPCTVKDAQTQGEEIVKNTKDASTSIVAAAAAPALSLGLGSRRRSNSSLLSSPESDKPPPPVNLHLCDKCGTDIKAAAEGILRAGQDQVGNPRTGLEGNLLAKPIVLSTLIQKSAEKSTAESTEHQGPTQAKTEPNSELDLQSPISPGTKLYQPPSPDLPWLSKIPRPVVAENPDVQRLKSALSFGNLSSLSFLASGRSTAPSEPSNGSPSYSSGANGSSMQRSKSNLTPSVSRRAGSSYQNAQMSPSTRSSTTTTTSTGNNNNNNNNVMGTPPPHPATPPLGSRRVGSPLARANSPHSSGQQQHQQQQQKSLIPKLAASGGPGSAGPTVGFPPDKPRDLNLAKPGNSGHPPSRGCSASTSSVTSPSAAEVKSLIPQRVATPPVLRRMYPKDGTDKLAAPDRNVVRKQMVSKATTGLINPDFDLGSRLTPNLTREGSLDSSGSRRQSVEPRQPSRGGISSSPGASSNKVVKGTGSDEEDKGNLTDDDLGGNGRGSSLLSSSGFPLPGVALFAPIDENRKKAEPSKEMRAALKVLKDSFLPRPQGQGASSTPQVVTNAVNIVQQEWFRTSSTKHSCPLDVEDYLDSIEDMSGSSHSPQLLLGRVVNMTDVNGNTALHYSVSHGNFDVVSVLLDSKVANPNILNKAGYTCIMLVSLAKIANDTHRAVIARLFSLGDVNIRAAQHGQTALMLAVSHGRLDMVRLLVDAGAGLNIRDEDGSTALMCAAEHGNMEIVRYLLAQPEVDANAKDNDGLTALAVAMEAGHRDVGVLMFAAMSSKSRNSSPYSSVRIKKSAGGALGAGGQVGPGRRPEGDVASSAGGIPRKIQGPLARVASPPSGSPVTSSSLLSKIPAPSYSSRIGGSASSLMQRSRSFTHN